VGSVLFVSSSARGIYGISTAWYSGLQVPVLSFGVATFGGKGEFFKAWGETDVKEATRLIDVCLENSVRKLIF